MSQLVINADLIEELSKRHQDLFQKELRTTVLHDKLDIISEEIKVLGELLWIVRNYPDLDWRIVDGKRIPPEPVSYLLDDQDKLLEFETAGRRHLKETFGEELTHI